jgi:dihydrofolate synthase/folylpolyglutamate synthase
LRVGCYTSPHLLAYNERVRVNGAPIEDAPLCSAFERVEAARQLAGHTSLTYFEFGTLAAWEVFAACGVDVAILEVGLGGRLDAVNVYDPDVAVVTGIALDHTDWLGSTREAIGFEKAGIFRGRRVAICADPAPPESLVEHAGSIRADLRLLGRDFTYQSDGDRWSFRIGSGRTWSGLPRPALKGNYQLRNASAVLAVIDALEERLPVNRAAVEAGLSDVCLPGRFQRVSERPAIFLDVAHNPQAVAAFGANLGETTGFRQTIAVVGMLADKDIAGALAPLAGKIDVWLVASLDVTRGASAATVATVIEAGKLGGAIECFSSPEAAFRRAEGLAGEDDRICVFGSFHTVGAVLRVIQSRSR